MQSIECHCSGTSSKLIIFPDQRFPRQHREGDCQREEEEQRAGQAREAAQVPDRQPHRRLAGSAQATIGRAGDPSQDAAGIHREGEDDRLQPPRAAAKQGGTRSRDRQAGGRAESDRCQEGAGADRVREERRVEPGRGPGPGQAKDRHHLEQHHQQQQARHSCQREQESGDSWLVVGGHRDEMYVRSAAHLDADPETAPRRFRETERLAGKAAERLGSDGEPHQDHLGLFRLFTIGYRGHQEKNGSGRGGVKS